MSKSRIEAFSDGVIAIIITIMVLEMKVPHGATFEALLPIIPVFLSYILSFVYLGIYWNNHHHLLHAAKSPTAAIMWANLHLLFWLSLIPFVTGWLGEHHDSALPMALYGFVLLCSAVAYFILQGFVISGHGEDSPLAKAVGSDWKGKSSVVCYAISIPMAFYSPAVSVAMYVLIAVLWLVPDRRMEAAFKRG